MPDIPIPLDLDEIRAVLDRGVAATGGEWFHALRSCIGEVERLRAELDQAAPHITYDKGYLDGARSAPAWDEEAVAEAIEQVFGWQHLRRYSGMSDEWMAATLGAILAVVREHLPASAPAPFVVPDREAMAWAMQCTDYGEDCYFATDEDYDDAVEPYRRYADAVIDLLLGRSEANHA